MKLNRIMIAAPKSGSGKTMITCALLQALKNSGKQVVSYKCGPDYIDPMFHQKVIDIPAKNLDSFFTDEEMTRKLFLQGRTGEEFAVLEGVMGMFDGLGGVREEGSSYHLATVTKTPIILVVDVKGMGRSVIPLIAGFMQYDKEKLIKGILLNRMSKGYYDIVRPLIEEELQIPVVGYFPEQKHLQIESRHLGLMMPDEMIGIREQLQEASEELTKTVSVEKIIAIAKAAKEVETVEESEVVPILQAPVMGKVASGKANKPVIAIAKDEAFCFYYEDNIQMLCRYGVEIKYFSPLHDKEVPAGCHGLLLGGGYPELYGEKLSQNKEMIQDMKQKIESGMPIVAECGGFMYLHSQMIDKDNRSYNMVGVLPGTCQYTGKLVRFGYMELEEVQSNFLNAGERIRGHEFHYFDSSDNGAACQAIKPTTGRRYPCVIAGENHWMGFPHLYYPSNPFFAENFVRKVRKYMEERQE